MQARLLCAASSASCQGAATVDKQKGEAGTDHADRGLVLHPDFQLHATSKPLGKVQRLRACRRGCLCCKECYAPRCGGCGDDQG